MDFFSQNLSLDEGPGYRVELFQDNCDFIRPHHLSDDAIDLLDVAGVENLIALDSCLVEQVFKSPSLLVYVADNGIQKVLSLSVARYSNIRLSHLVVVVAERGEVIAAMSLEVVATHNLEVDTLNESDLADIHGSVSGFEVIQNISLVKLLILDSCLSQHVEELLLLNLE